MRISEHCPLRLEGRRLVGFSERAAGVLGRLLGNLRIGLLLELRRRMTTTAAALRCPMDRMVMMRPFGAEPPQSPSITANSS